jgi:hypothetical protein
MNLRFSYNNSIMAVVTDSYAEILNDPTRMWNTVRGLKNAVDELPPNVRKVLKYISIDSLDPEEPVSVVCDFISSLDAYLTKLERENNYLLSPKLARRVRWSIISCGKKESKEIYDQELFQRIGERMGREKDEGPSFIDINNFIEELTEAGVLSRHQAPHSEATYSLTPEAVEALNALKKIRRYPWAYPINILPKGRVVMEDEKGSSFPEYRKRFLELERQIIEGSNPNLPENV